MVNGMALWSKRHTINGLHRMGTNLYHFVFIWWTQFRSNHFNIEHNRRLHDSAILFNNISPHKNVGFLMQGLFLVSRGREVERSSLSCYSLPASMGSSSSSLGRLARFTNWPILKWKEWVSIFKLPSYMIWSLIFICYHHPHHVWWNIFSTLNRNNLLILDHYQGCICKILNSSEL
jgi:hypothetical protein